MSASLKCYFSLLLTRAITQTLMIDSRAVLSRRGARQGDRVPPRSDRVPGGGGCPPWSIRDRILGWCPSKHGDWCDRTSWTNQRTALRQCATAALSDRCKYVSRYREWTRVCLHCRILIYSPKRNQDSGLTAQRWTLLFVYWKQPTPKIHLYSHKSHKANSRAIGSFIQTFTTRKLLPMCTCSNCICS